MYKPTLSVRFASLRHLLLVALLAASLGPGVFAARATPLPAPAAASGPQTRGPRVPDLAFGMVIEPELEPNDFFALATPVLPNAMVDSLAVFGASLSSGSDVDWFSFQVTTPGTSRVYAMTETDDNHASTNTDTMLALYKPDGTTVLESDGGEGNFGLNSSSIAGTVITQTGTYYLKVTTGVNQAMDPYRLFIHVQPASPTILKVEPNNNPIEAQVIPGLPALITGTMTGTLPNETDWYAFPMNVGDTVLISLDENPDRGGSDLTAYVGIGMPTLGVPLYRMLNNHPEGPPYSNSIVYTAATTGVYYAYVAAVQGSIPPPKNYQLSITIQVPTGPMPTCGPLYLSNGSQPIPDPGTLTDTLTVPDAIDILDLSVRLWITHTRTADLVVRLHSPQGTQQTLFSNVGGNNPSAQNFILTWIDDQAALPISSDWYSIPTLAPFVGMWMPEPNGGLGDNGGSLSAFNGENSQGTWQLDVEDQFGSNSGVLYGWILQVCGVPIPATPGPTATDTPTAQPSATATATASATASATATTTATTGPSATSTATATTGPSATPTATATTGPSATPTRTPTAGPSATATATATTGPSATPTRTPTAGPSATATATATTGPSATPTRTATAGPSPTPTGTATPGPSPTPTVTVTAGPSSTPTPTGVPSSVQVQQVEAASAAPGASWPAVAAVAAGSVLVAGLFRRRRTPGA